MERDEDELSVTSESSAVGKTKKQCQKCKRAVLSVKADHDVCIHCLGPDHNMITCHACQALSERNKIIWAQRLSHWKFEKTPACPSSATIRELLKKETIPDHLSLENVSKLFTLPPEDSDEEGSGVEGGDDQNEEEVVPLLIQEMFLRFLSLLLERKVLVLLLLLLPLLLLLRLQ